MIFIKKNIFVFFSLIFLTIFSNKLLASNVKILFKINNEIITNLDVEKEYRYLTTLNQNLIDIEKEKMIEYSKQSLIKEIIKKQELINNYDLDQKSIVVENMIVSIYKELGFNSDNEFKNYLKKKNLEYDEIYKKIIIESIWNQHIYEKFKDQVKIDKEELKRKIISNPKQIEKYSLSELVFSVDNKNEINSKYQEILSSFNSVGFKETVIKYSISKSKNIFGELGWVNKNALSEKIKTELENIEPGQVTKPIIISSGILILKLEEKKIENVEIDIDIELDNLVKFETNNQLNNYSVMYFNKIKNNSLIDEL